MVKGIYVGQNLIFAMIACTGMLYRVTLPIPQCEGT